MNELQSSGLSRLIKPLLNNRGIVVHESVPAGFDLQPMARSMVSGTGQIHLFSSNIMPGESAACVLHESFHAAPDSLTSSRQWKRLVNTLGTLYDKASRPGSGDHWIWAAAKDRALFSSTQEVNVSRDHQVNEFGAYAIEEYEQASRSLRRWVNNVAGTVKAWGLRRLGVQVGRVSPGQLRALARYSLRHKAKDWPNTGKLDFSAPQYSLAYHGTPYEFDAFCLADAITPESDNSFGYGHYFSETLGVAEGYAELGKGTGEGVEYLIHGATVEKDSPDHEAAKLIERLGVKAARQIAKEMLEDILEAEQSEKERLLPWFEQIYETTQAVNRKEEISRSPGRIFVCDIPDDEYLLDYDRQLADQSPQVRDALGLTAFATASAVPSGDTWSIINDETKEIISRNWADKAAAERFASLGDRGEQTQTGKDFYLQKIKELGSDKAASAYLRQLGIKGLKYADGFTRGKLTGRNMNFVVWDDDAISITAVVRAHEPPPPSIQALIQDALDSAIAGGNDAEVYTTLRNLERDYPGYKDGVREAFDSVASFFEDSEHPFLAARARATQRRLSGATLRAQIHADYGEDFGGLQLSNSDRTRFAIFLEDASSPGNVRYQPFDKYGFSSHVTKKSYEEALVDAIENGFRVPAPGALEALMNSPSFTAGMAYAARIAKFNAGEISMEEVSQGLPDGGPLHGDRPASDIYLTSSKTHDFYVRRALGKADKALIVSGKGPADCEVIDSYRVLRLSADEDAPEYIKEAAIALKVFGYDKPRTVSKQEIESSLPSPSPGR